MFPRSDARKPAGNSSMTIQTHQITKPILPRIQTPVDPSPPTIISPRRAPLPPSPTFSNHSNVSGLSAYDERSRSDRSRKNSFDTGGRGSFEAKGPPVPRKDEKRLPGLPSLPFAGLHMPGSPHRRGSGRDARHANPTGAGAGLYDNKLVSSTLSQPALIPPISPTPTGNSSFSNLQVPTHGHPLITKPSFTSIMPSTLRPAASSSSNSYAGVVLPDGTALSTAGLDSNIGAGMDGQRSMKETLAHSSPSSPWSLLTIHSLPIFAGSSLKSSIEDLNQLCHQHITGTSQRTAPSRLVAVLSSDLRDFIASGMLTLKAKIETVDESRLIAKTAETWAFFWTHVLSVSRKAPGVKAFADLQYLEGVFLPFSQMRDILPSSSTTPAAQPIPVRHILLSGFLLHILLPLLPRLIPIITMTQSAAATLPSDSTRANGVSSTSDLRRILQMSLILSSQAAYSTFLPSQTDEARQNRDADVKENVAGLGKAVRWRMAFDEQSEGGEIGPETPAKSPADWTPRRASLQRNLSVTQAGRHRRKGWRASTSFGQNSVPHPTSTEGVYGTTARQNSDFFQPEARWGRPRVDEEDDDDTTPGQSLMTSRQNSFAVGTTASGAPSAASTLTAAGTWRDGDFTDTQRTPQAEFSRRPMRADSIESVDNTPIVVETRRAR